jgi:hypothetical protein
MLELRVIFKESHWACWFRLERCRIREVRNAFFGGGTVNQMPSWMRVRFYYWAKVSLLQGLILVVVLTTLSVRMSAQVASGVNGTIADTTGAVFPGANVNVTNTSTGVSAHVSTSSVGTYTIMGLLPGNYVVVVSAPGFKTVTTNVTIEVSKVSTLNLRLEAGSTTETVRVSESDITLNTTSPDLGTTLEPELIKNAPIEINSLARQIDSFIYLAPGVQGNAQLHNINGGVTIENAVEFNGVPVAFADYSGEQTYINPPYEMVNEFRVNSSTFDARFGIGQGVVSYNMASGTNTFHADAFEILRNQLFDSDGFFPVRFGANGKPLPPVDQQNDYGFTVSGPVIIPRLYNGKSRTFLLFSSDWFKQNQALNAYGTVPTVAMKNGDFSNFVDANGKQIPIYDPETGQPFPGNVIPKSRFSAISQAILPSVPDPNYPGVLYGEQSNEAPAVHSVPISQHLWGYTIDQTLSSSQNIHFSQWRDSVSSPYFTSAAIVPVSNEIQSEESNTQLGSGFLLNYSKTVTPNLVASVGADWVGIITKQENDGRPVDFAGVTGSSTFPLIEFSDQTYPTWWGTVAETGAIGLEGGLTTNSNRRLGIVLANNWLWTRGRHTINYGVQYRHTFQDNLGCYLCGGTFSFSQRTTSIPNSNDPSFASDGSAFASFLLGQVDSAVRIEAQEIYLRNQAFAYYFQDDFKINNRLTVNFGMRHDIMIPFTEKNDNIVYVNYQHPSVLDPGAGNLPGGSNKFGNCPLCGGISRAAIHWRNLQPRVGFSYALTPKTVLQSGFYITFLDGGGYEYGTAQTSFYYTSLLFGEFARQSTFGSTPAYGSWDGNPMPVPQGVPFTPSIGNGGVTMALNPSYAGTAPYDQAWNLTLQRQLPWDMFLSVAYVGNRAIHLPVTLIQPDQPPVSVLQYGSLLAESVTSPDAVAAGIKIPYPEFVQQFGGSATVEQALAPFPQYAGIYNLYEVDGTSFYNAVQVQAEKRFSDGLSYLVGFTSSMNKSNTQIGDNVASPNGENSYNERPEYSRSTLDQKYVTNFVATYDLPVGLGKRYLNSKGLMAQFLGGWQVSGILTYQGGVPMQVANSFNPLEFDGFDRPNVVPNVRMKTYNYGLSRNYFTGKTASQPIQFTTNAFQNTGPWQLGDAIRSYSALRTPPLRIENFDAIKYFHLTEHLKASLRVDYFNAFNRTQFQSPDQNSTDSTFGLITNLSSQISNRQGQATFRLEF